MAKGVNQMTDTASKTDYIVATDAAPIAVDVVADIGNARTVVLCAA